jgi:hypothetical protein
MNRVDGRIWWGVLLILGGILFLLQNLGLLIFGDFWVWAVLMGAGGLGFLYVVYRNQHNWWAVIPGLILVYLALLVVLDRLLPAFSNDFGGPLFLATIGAAFFIVYALKPLNWWAIIPGGVMLTLAVVAGTDRFLPGMESGGIFFLGLGITFLVLSLISTPFGKMRWPLIPGGILFLMGVLLSISATGFLNVLWPIALIVVGVYLFFLRAPIRRS